MIKKNRVPVTEMNFVGETYSFPIIHGVIMPYTSLAIWGTACASHIPYAIHGQLFPALKSNSHGLRNGSPEARPPGLDSVDIAERYLTYPDTFSIITLSSSCPHRWKWTRFAEPRFIVAKEYFQAQLVCKRPCVFTFFFILT